MMNVQCLLWNKQPTDLCNFLNVAALDQFAYCKIWDIFTPSNAAFGSSFCFNGVSLVLLSIPASQRPYLSHLATELKANSPWGGMKLIKSWSLAVPDCLIAAALPKYVLTQSVTSNLRSGSYCATLIIIGPSPTLRDFVSPPMRNWISSPLSTKVLTCISCNSDDLLAVVIASNITTFRDKSELEITILWHIPEPTQHQLNIPSARVLGLQGPPVEHTFHQLRNCIQVPFLTPANPVISGVPVSFLSPWPPCLIHEPGCLVRNSCVLSVLPDTRQCHQLQPACCQWVGVPSSVKEATELVGRLACLALGDTISMCSKLELSALAWPSP